MKLDDLNTIEQLSQFLDGTQAVIFKLDTAKKKRYQWIQHELVRFDYLRISKADKGIVIRYLIKVTSYSRQQITRLIKQYRRTGYIKHQPATNNGFKGKYTTEDIRLIARMDERHDTPCGQAIKKLCERAYGVFDEQKYKRLSTISVSHLYNPRKSKTYSKTRTHLESQAIFLQTGHHFSLSCLLGQADHTCPSEHCHSSFVLEFLYSFERQKPPWLAANSLIVSIDNL